MIEVIILSHLKTELNDVPVVMEVPRDKPSEYVLIEKTGSSCENHLFDSMFAVQSHSTSLYKAAELNERVKAAMLNAVDLDEVAGVSLNSDYNFTDGAAAEYRYQAVFDVTHY